MAHGKGIRRFGLAAWLLAAPFLAHAAWNGPSVQGPAPKRFVAEAFRVPLFVTSEEVRLDPVDPSAIEHLRAENGSRWEKRLDIGVHRELEPRPLVWERAAGGHVARLRLTSPGAPALRIGLRAEEAGIPFQLRFAGVGAPSGVFGPFSRADVANGGHLWWSPVLDGETAMVEVFVPGPASPRDVSLEFRDISHLFVHPADPDLEMHAKNGASGSCEVDLVCRSASDPALASLGKSVARMVFGAGSTCTGTLLNPTGAQVPYFYSAHHCINSQSTANTLVTYWFYERSACGSGGPALSSVPQVLGGAQLLYSSQSTDVLLLRLNGTPPVGAVYAAWDSSTLTNGTALTAVHHPSGDWKKVSLATMGGFASPGNPSGSFIVANWTLAVTEPGSSGSGIFSAVGSPASEYRFRGGLYGGPSSCSPSSIKLDYYSRFDQAFAQLSQYLNPATPSYTITVTRSGAGSGTVSGTGINCGTTCSASHAAGTVVSLTATPASGSVFGGWGGACSGSTTCQVTLDAAKTVTATFNLDTPPALSLTPATIDFGPQLIGATSPARTFSVRNSGGGSLVVNSMLADAAYSISHGCTTLAAGASCPVSVRFTPPAGATYTGAVAVQSSAGGGSVNVSGLGRGSLVGHYYQSILRRGADVGGLGFWEAEAIRVSSLGANVNEAWFALAQTFYSSAEYVAFNRSADGYVTDLYTTFFNRPPDAGGLAFWTGQIAQGMPREVVLVAFMFSAEFAAFTQGLYGNTAARAEVDTVMDFYRGLLSRLPDSAGFAFWVQQFRAAQCQGSGAGVSFLAEQISSAFATGPEYTSRNRSHGQYVADLYNAFLRRGGDLSGVQFWTDQIASGARTREQVRQLFLASPEFQARVSAVIAQGCTS